MSQNYKPKGKGRPRPVVKCGPSLTKQQFKDQVNINNIVARYLKTGALDHLAQNAPQFADCLAVPDYRESLEKIQHAENMFNMLPAGLRARFGNDPSQMLEFVNKEENRTEAEKLGLLKAKVSEPEPTPAPAPEPDPAPKTPKKDTTSDK